MTRLPTSSTIPIASLLSSPPSPLSFIYSSHSSWPYPPNSTTSTLSPTISVLDSSFNPPHAAHKALAETVSSSSDSTPPQAHLLTFTISNADKKLDEKDLFTRLEMIRSMAIDLNRQDSKNWNNVAVAVLDAATFVKKAEILKREIPKLLLSSLLKQQQEEEEKVIEFEPNFVFPVGWDTLIRIFASRYYPPPGPDLSTSMETLFSTNRSSLVCARRASSQQSQQVEAEEEEQEFLSRPEVDKWVKLGKLKVVDLKETDSEIRSISSTRIREMVKKGDWDGVKEMVPFASVVEVIKKERLYQ
ncbi:hypothetical protein JCM3765_002621 [Sporobolomyces pararoseus]